MYNLYRVPATRKNHHKTQTQRRGGRQWGRYEADGDDDRTTNAGMTGNNARWGPRRRQRGANGGNRSRNDPGATATSASGNDEPQQHGGEGRPLPISLAPLHRCEGAFYLALVSVSTPSLLETRGGGAILFLFCEYFVPPSLET